VSSEVSGEAGGKMSDAATSRSQTSLLRSFFGVSTMNLLTRISGLGRDIAIAGWIGITAGTDAFFIVFGILGLLRNLLAEPTVKNTGVVVLSARSALADHRRLFIAAASGCLGLLLFALLLLLLLAAPALTLLAAPGFWAEAGRLAETTTMLRMALPFMLFISLAALASAVLEAHRRFMLPALAPMILNLSLILVAMGVGGGLLEVTALAWGTSLGGLLMLLVQLPYLARLGMLVRPRLDWRQPDLGVAARLIWPLWLVELLLGVPPVLGLALLSTLETGSVSWNYYALRLFSLPVGLFMAALAVVSLPALANYAAAREQASFSRLLAGSMKLSLVFIVPCAIAMLLLAEPVVITLFQRGAFEARDAEFTAQILRCFALCLLVFVPANLLANAFRAIRRTRELLRLHLWVVAWQMLLMLLMFLPLIRYELGYLVVPLSLLAAQLIKLLLLWRRLVAVGYVRGGEGGWRLALQVAFASLLLAGALSWTDRSLELWLGLDEWRRLLHLLAVCGMGLVVYGTGLAVAGLRPRVLQSALRAPPGPGTGTPPAGGGSSGD